MSIAAIALLAGLLAVGAGLGLYRRVLAAPATNARANEIADAIRTKQHTHTKVHIEESTQQLKQMFL
jgi:Na+/H+-translocating membrane pyrophosphatase